MKTSENNLKMQLALVDRGISLFLKKNGNAEAKTAQSEADVMVNIFMGTDDVCHQKWEVAVQGSNLGDLLAKTAELNEQFIDRSGFSLNELIKVREQTVLLLQQHTSTSRTNVNSKYSPHPQGENSVRLTKLDLDFLELGIKILQREKEINEPGFTASNPVAIVADYGLDVMVTSVVAEAWQLYQAYRSGADVSREATVMQKLLSTRLSSENSLDQLIAARNELAAQLR